MLNFFTKQLLKHQLKGMPPEQLEKIFAIIEQNPDLFMRMAKDIETKVKSGMSQEEAVKAIMEDKEFATALSALKP